MSAIDPQFAADFTDRYAPYLNPQPEVNSFREFARFVPAAQRSGRQFRGPMQSSISQGVTWDLTGTAYALNAARPAGEQEYILDGPDLLVRETFPYSAALKASNGVSKDGQAAAYWEPMDKVMMTMMRGIDHQTEMAMMFGCGSGATIIGNIGVLAATPQIGGPVAWNAGPLIQLTALSWAPGIWNNSGDGGNAAGGMLVDVLNAAGTAIVATNIPVQSIDDPALCRVKMKAGGTGATNPALNEQIIPAGTYQKCCAGVQGWLQNTGLLANINAATNWFWRARQFNAAGKMTRAKVLQICAKLFPNGAKKGLVAFCNAHTFADLAEETSTPSFSGGQWFENGAETRVQGAANLEYVSPVGKVEVRVHEYQKQGFMFFLEPGNTVRIGAADTTVRGSNGSEGFFLELPNNAGSEMRVTSQQAPFIRYPARCAIATGIVSDGQDQPA